MDSSIWKIFRICPNQRNLSSIALYFFQNSAQEMDLDFSVSFVIKNKVNVISFQIGRGAGSVSEPDFHAKIL